MKPETIKKAVKLLGVSEQQAKELEYRRTGKTTARALETIAEALRNHNKPIDVRDHYGSKESDRHLLREIHSIVSRLDLVGFKFNETKRTVEFDLKELQKKAFGFALD